VTVFIVLSIILNVIIYTSNDWNFYFIFGYFADVTVPVVNSPVVPDYHPAVVVVFSLFLAIFHRYVYVNLFSSVYDLSYLGPKLHT